MPETHSLLTSVGFYFYQTDDYMQSYRAGFQLFMQLEEHF